MTLVIPEPCRYYCHFDEKYFFKWLRAIPAVEEVVGTSAGLTLKIREPIDQSSFYELVGLMTRYGVDLKSLRPLCMTHSDSWFRAASNYWYSSVFND